MKSTALHVLVLAATAVAACGPDPAVEQTRRVIDELVAQDFGAASTRYRRYESEVLSAAAAPVWRDAVGHADSTVRQWAVDALSRIGEPGDLDAIRDRLGDSSRGVRKQAVLGLVRMDRSVARAEFARLLGADAPASVVLGAQGLVELSGVDAAAPDDAPAARAPVDPELLELLIDRFSSDSLPAASRGSLADTLSRLDDPTAVPALFRVAAQPTADKQLRRLAAEALAAIDGEAALAAVHGLVDSDDDYIRSLARALKAGSER